MSKAFFILNIILLSVSTLFAQDKEKIAADSTHKWIKELNNNYRWGNIKISSSLDSLFPSNHFNKILSEGKPIDSIILINEIERVLRYFEQNAYPFAEIKFDSIYVQKEIKKVNAVLIFSKNNKIILDSLKITGKQVVSTHFLSSYLDLKPGSLYNEQKIKSIQKRIDELPFLKLNSPIQVYFINNKSVVALNTDSKNANKFDGLIGVQPNNSTQKTSIVGQAQLNLINVFNRAEKLFFDFRSQANNTRDVKLFFNYPYVLRTNLGVDFNLDIRRQDSSFSDFGRGLGIQYLLSGNNQIRFVYKVEESNLLSTKKYKNSSTLPEVIDIKKFSYGTNIQLENLDYRINPKRGYSIQSTILLTQRNITKNADIEDSLYRGLDLKNNQLQVQFSGKLFLPIFKSSTLLTSFTSKWINGGALFRNELLRFGGINDLRGFDEEAIFASYYWNSSIEYRFLFDKNSFMRVFYDQAYYSNSITAVNDYPYGIGVGAQVETNAGMLQLNYALGSQQNSGLNFRTGKIHFGIINYF